jgi:hydroxypyruvate isomerase
MSNFVQWFEPFRLVANVSILLPDVAFEDRPAMAAEHGFDWIESWWPFADAQPSESDRQGFVDAIAASGVGLTLLNTPAGNMAAGQRGLGAIPGREREFADWFDCTLDVSAIAGGRFVHAMLGNGGDHAPEALDDVGLRNLEWAARHAAGRGHCVVIEVLNLDDNPGYVMSDLDKAIRWIETVRRRVGDDGRIGMLFDAYHLTRLGYDLGDAVQRAAHVIEHVQVADVPGRGAPGSGAIDWGRFVAALTTSGYDGAVSFEYRRQPGEPFPKRRA